MLCIFDPTFKQVLQTLVLTHLDYCMAIWSGVPKKDLGKLPLSQNRAAHLVLHCKQSVNINKMPASLTWLKVEERVTASLLVFMINIAMMKIPHILYNQITYSSDRYTYVPNQTCHQESLHNPHIQNKFKATHSIE
jgi:hypothetical protein